MDSLHHLASVRGRGEVALVLTWLGGSSWRGRFGDGDSGVSISTPSISARAAAAWEGSGARSMHDHISLLIADSSRGAKKSLNRRCFSLLRDIFLEVGVVPYVDSIVCVRAMPGGFPHERI